jgi:hypothetical protein
MTTSNLETNRFEGARRFKRAALQFSVSASSSRCSALFAGVNALNFTTKTWVTILLVASYDLFFIIRPSCRSRM